MIWRRNVFVSQGKKADHAIDHVTGRESFNFNNTLLNVVENEFTDPIFIINKISQCMKDCILIGHKLLAGTCISIEKLDVIDARGPSQEASYVHSRRLNIASS